MRKLPYQSSLQFIQRPQLLWSDIGDRKLWGGIQWIRHGPTVPSRLSWNAYQSNITKLRSGIRWKHGMRRFSEYGNVASRNISERAQLILTCQQKSPKIIPTCSTENQMPVTRHQTYSNTIRSQSPGSGAATSGAGPWMSASMVNWSAQVLKIKPVLIW